VLRPWRAVGSRVRTYTAGKDDDGSPEQADSREWVFGLLETPRYRRRMQQLEAMDLRRRAGCEPCLRALVVGSWTPETLHHLGWCDSCRRAAIALGMQAPADEGPAWYRRHAAWLAVAAFAVVAVPLVGSQVIDRGSQVGVRGGSATAVPGVIATDPGTTPGTTTPGTTTPVIAQTTTTGPPTTTITPVPRRKPASAVGHQRGGAKKALPHTT
jgi:hypothetical protein